MEPEWFMKAWEGIDRTFLKPIREENIRQAEWARVQAQPLRQGPKNVTGNKILDAGLHLLGSRMVSNAWNEKHTHSRGILFMNSMLLIDGFTSPRSSFKYRNRPRVKYENFGENTYLAIGDTPVGSFSVDANKTLSLDLTIPNSLQGKGYGSEIFQKAAKDASTFEAAWYRGDYEKGMSDNLIQYYGLRKQKLTPKKSAFGTWSGKQAEKSGFTKVKVDENVNGVDATFTK